MEIETTYIPPAIIADYDDDLIHERMLSNLPPDIDKMEGGFAHDFTRPAALEKAEMLVAINDAIRVFFPEWSYAGYLDKLAAGVGLTRKAATATMGVLTVTGTEGTVIPKGYLFCTPSTAISANVDYETVDEIVIGNDETAQVPVRCTEAGIVGNVPANCIVLMVSPMEGITGITNENAFIGGTDMESDDALRLRVMEADRSEESSYAGNDADYKRWALEVDGVGSCLVVPEWEGTGTGTVKLIIMDSNGDPATPTLISNVYNHIASPNNRDDRLAPIGAILTVATASSVQINITASVHLLPGTVLTDVQAAFAEAVQDYFTEAKADGYVRYTRIGRLLSKTGGVLDYEDLTLNDGTTNVSIGSDYYPVLSVISIADADAPEPDPEPEPDHEPEPGDGDSVDGENDGGGEE